MAGEQRNLLLSDVWQPHQADDFIKVVQMGDYMQEAKLRNRLSAMKMGEAEFNQRMKDAEIQAAGGEEAYFKKQQDATRTKLMRDQMTAGAELLKKYKTVLGMKGVKENWEKIKETLPEPMRGINPEQLTEGGLLVHDQNGNPIGQWTENPEGGAPHFIKFSDPTGVDATMLKGFEQDLRDKHGKLSREPWDESKIKIEAAKMVKIFNTDEGIRKQVAQQQRMESTSFKGWTTQQKEMAYKDYYLTGKQPKFSWGDKVSYTAFDQGYYQWLIDKGKNVTGPAKTRAEYRSDVHSLQYSQKMYDQMNGFVINLNKQVEEVKKRYAGLPRVDMKWFNIPIAKIRTMVTGSGEEAAIKSYLIDISNECGRLSAGNAASIRELSTEAQERWKEIHDERLSYNEILKVLDASSKQGNMRLDSQAEQINKIKDRIDGYEVDMPMNTPYSQSEPGPGASAQPGGGGPAVTPQPPFKVEIDTKDPRSKNPAFVLDQILSSQRKGK